MSSPHAAITRAPVEIYGRHLGYGFAGLDVNTAIGNFTQTTVDLSFPASLLGLLDWRRTYNSLSGAIGALGPGWTTSLTARLVPAAGSGAQPVTLFDEDGRQLTFTPAPGGGYTRPQDLDADLARSNDGSFTLTYNSGLACDFDATGRLTQRSLEGQAVSLSYSSDDLLLHAQHSPSGRQLDFSYDANRRLTQAASSDGRTVSFGYTAGDVTSALLDTATVPGGGVTHFEWTGTGEAAQLTRITEPDGNLTVANSYDAATRRVTSQDLPLGGAAAFSYSDAGLTTVTTTPGDTAMTFQADSNGRLTQVTDAAGNTGSFSYNGDGRVTGATLPGGGRRTYTYDSGGNVLSSTFGGQTQAWAYDDAGRLTTLTDTSGGESHFAYPGASRIPSQVTDPGGGTTQLSSASGQVTERTDADGNTSSYTYDQAGHVVSATDPLGEVTRYVYDTAGNRIAIIAPSGATTRFGYDSAGRITARTDPDGNTTSYQYSAAGRLTQATDPAGAVTAYGYDEAGYQTSVTDPLGRVTRSSYDGLGNLTSVTDPLGAVTSYAYDQSGRLVTITDPLSSVTHLSYDADGRETERQTPAGTTTTSYDERGNPVSVTDPAGGVTHLGYDSSDRVISRTDPTGNVWQLSYDAAGNVVTETDPLGGTTRRRWTPAGRLAGVIDPIGRETTYGYDADGRLTTVTDPGSGATRYTYDQDGRRHSATTPAGLITGYRYDPAGRLIATVDPRGWVTRYEYDARGDKIAQITPSGAVTRLRYDAARQLTEMTDPNGSVTRYDYDAAGHLTKVTDAKGAVTVFGYDAAGRQTSVTDPLGRETTNTYDAAGNLITITSPSGQAEHLAYDADGRLISKTAAGTADVTFGYDAAGHRTSMTDPTGTTRYAYDQAGRLTQVTVPDGGVFTAGYDAAGQRVSLSYPAGLQVAYSYDLNGRLTSLQDSRAGQAVYALDPDGRLLTEQLPGRSARRYHYADGLLHRFTVIRDDAPEATTSFSYDPDGRIATERDDDGLASYRYDPAGQLVSAVREGRPELHLEYDAVGNRVSMQQGEVATRYRYDVADQLLGTETQGRHVEFRYDSLGRLTEEIDGEFRRVISYDGFGLPVTVDSRLGRERSERIQAVFTGDELPASLVLTRQNTERDEARSASVRYQWSNDSVPQILAQRAEPALDDAEHDQPGELTADFAYGYGRTFASWAHGGAAFHHDAFGSTVRTDDTQGWAQADRYDPFGTPLDLGQEPSPSPELPRFGYRGELALGSLLYLRARTYNSALGRFSTRDPVTFPAGQNGPAPASNPYAYAVNDPLNRTDPSGEQFGFLGRLVSGGEHLVGAGVHDIVHAGEDVGSFFAGLGGSIARDVVPVLDTIRHDAAHYADVVIREIATHPIQDIIAAVGAIVAVLLAPEIIAIVLGALAAIAEVLLDVLLIAIEVAIEVAIEALIVLGLRYLFRQIRRVLSPSPVDEVTREALYAFGNKSNPRLPRIEGEGGTVDFHVHSRDDNVGPFSPTSPQDVAEGASTFIDPKRAPLKGWYHRLPEGTVLPTGMGVHADGVDVGGPAPWGHRTIYPSLRMTVNHFDGLYLGLPWERAVGRNK